MRNATRPTLVGSGAFEKTETKCKWGVENTKDVGYPSLTWSSKLQIAFDEVHAGGDVNEEKLNILQLLYVTKVLKIMLSKRLHITSLTCPWDAK